MKFFEMQGGRTGSGEGGGGGVFITSKGLAPKAFRLLDALIEDIKTPLIASPKLMNFNQQHS